MCTCFFHIPQNNSKIPFFICFNRDENPLRGTDQLDYWKDDTNILGGRDSIFKGSWFSLNVKTGNVAFLTNLDDDNIKTKNYQIGMKSRGKVIKQFTSSNFYVSYTIESFIDEVVKESSQYNPFNLVLGNIKSMNFYFVDIYNSKCIQLPKNKIMGFSNNLFMTTKWKKVEDSLIKFNNYDSINIDNILEVMEYIDSNMDININDRDDFIFKVPYFSKQKPGLSATISCSILIGSKNKFNFYEKTYQLLEIQKIKKFMLYRRQGSLLKNASRFLTFLQRQQQFQKSSIEKNIEFDITNQFYSLDF